MGLLARIRAWIRGFTEDASESEPTETDEPTADPRLDPDNVTEARTSADDDAVERLQTMQESQTESEHSEN